MEKPANPFLLKGYINATYFCNRVKETQTLTSNAINGVNTTLISARRMGKTGLIHHCFNQLNRKHKIKGIYIDIYATQNLSDFINTMASSILSLFPQNKSIGKKFIEVLKGFSPTISYDPFTGNPEVSLTFNTETQQEHSLAGLLKFLDEQNQPILVAFDEFQQISNYPEKNIEALLRTYIQQLNNVSFIFSGSHKHLLLEIFNNTKKPFFSSTQLLNLTEIDKKDYEKFIQSKFKKNGKTIEKEGIEFILSWTKTHTYYTQSLCNKVFANTEKLATLKDVYENCSQLLKEQEPIFFQYRNLLTKKQWNVLKAIGKENRVYQPTGNKFISTHKIGNPASVRRSLEALLEKEMVFKNTDEKGETYYQVYDCFLSRWLERI